MKGAVTVDSTVGEGTNFSIFLHPSMSALKKRTKRQLDSISIGGTENVLLIIDDVLVKRAIDRSLKEHGYGVTTLSSEKEWMSMSFEELKKFSLMIFDVRTRKIPSKDWLEEIEMSGLKLPVLMFKRNSSLDDGELPKQAARYYYLEKPFVMNAFQAKVRQILESN